MSHSFFYADKYRHDKDNLFSNLVDDVKTGLGDENDQNNFQIYVIFIL